MKKHLRKSIIGGIIAITSAIIANLITLKSIQLVNVLISLIVGAAMGLLLLNGGKHK